VLDNFSAGGLYLRIVRQSAGRRFGIRRRASLEWPAHRNSGPSANRAGRVVRTKCKETVLAAWL